MQEHIQGLVYVFRSTSDALNFQNSAEMAELPGRLIPVPRVISASCGLAWLTQEEAEADFAELIRSCELDVEAVHHLN